MSRSQDMLAYLAVLRPPAVLLYGPGSWPVARELGRLGGASVADSWAIDGLSVDGARSLVRWAGQAPVESDRKVAIVHLDDSTESGAVNVLLSLVEEPPKGFSVIFATEGNQPPPLESRCLTYNLVTEKITGNVTEHPRVKVLSILKAVARKDRDLLEKAAVGFDKVGLDLLVQWTVEAITGHWETFSEEDSFGLTEDPNVARRMLIALSPDVRPRILVKTAFEDLMK